MCSLIVSIFFFVALVALMGGTGMGLIPIVATIFVIALVVKGLLR